MIGQTISHYTVVEKLGGGGMGIVYKARDLKLDRFVALKFLPHEISSDPECKSRFVREAKAASAIDHPNICTIHEIDETGDGQMFIVMAHYPGETLKRKIQRRPLPLAESVELAIQVCQGLAQAHQRGIVHRDIKPANVMVSDAGVVKIVDFGLAQLGAATKLTKTGSTLGTPAYMSPEQIQGLPLDHRTDIWSLGVVIYEMVTGRPPFEAEHDQAVMYRIANTEPEPITGLRAGVPIEIDRIVGKALAKDREQRYQHVDDMLVDLRSLRRQLEIAELRPVVPQRPTAKAPAPPPPQADALPREPDANLAQPERRAVTGSRGLWVAAGAIAVLVALGFVLVQSRLTPGRSRAETLLALQEHVSRREMMEAFVLARDARDDLAEDPEFAEIWDNVARSATIRTDPPGVKVSVRPYGDFTAGWVEIGRSPLESEAVPQASPLQLRLEMEGFQTREVAVPPTQLQAGVQFKLDAIERGRDDVVRVPPQNGEKVTVSRRPSAGILETTDLPAFEIDRFEVTNRQFAEFVEAGGYLNRELWKIPFVLNDREIPFEQAMENFVDATGRPGPAAWRFGAYPDGQQDHPVGGVSWYEAAAYAEFAGKRLPTLHHWDAASGARGAGYLVLSSNLGDGPLPVGSTPARSPAGLADTAGNVREWCWNAVGRERLALGAAWNDAPYMFDRLVSRNPFDRDPGNGFRCARYDPAAIRPELLGPVERRFRDYSQERPASDREFEIFQRFYAYEPAALNAVSHETREERYWTIEEVSYDSAYGERIPAYLYLPKNAAPPYQAVLYFPGSVAELTPMSKNRNELLMRPLVRSGRAVLYPVYKGTYERAIRGESPVYLTLDAPVPTRPQARQDNVIMAIRDVFRSVDYLQSRDDMLADTIAYVGASLGARHGAIALGLEHRFRAAVLLDGGLHLTPKDQRLPESDEINFLPRIQTPTLMVSGRFDGTFPVEESQRYFYQWLGAAPKKHSLSDRGHLPMLTDEAIREMLGWLDEHLGVPVRTPRGSESAGSDSN